MKLPVKHKSFQFKIRLLMNEVYPYFAFWIHRIFGFENKPSPEQEDIKNGQKS